MTQTIACTDVTGILVCHAHLEFVWIIMSRTTSLKNLHAHVIIEFEAVLRFGALYYYDCIALNFNF